MQERKNNITMHGKALTLQGPEIKEGDKAPDFVAVDQNLNPVQFSSFNGKIRLLLTVPSLDTSVCSTETRKFNQELEKLGNQVVGIVVSMDLPFAQKRWCGVEGVKNVVLLSDYQKSEVGEKYGVLIKDLHLLARAIFVIDANGIVKYVHFVKEVTQEPNYKEVIEEIQKLLTSVK